MHTLSVNSLNIKEERSKFCKEPEKNVPSFLCLYSMKDWSELNIINTQERIFQRKCSELKNIRQVHVISCLQNDFCEPNTLEETTHTSYDLVR